MPMRGAKLLRSGLTRAGLAQVKREAWKDAPVVLGEEVEGVGAKVVRAGAELKRGLLGKAEEEVGKIVAGVGDGLRGAGSVLRSGKAGEDETSFGISGGLETLENAAIVSAKAPIVLAVIPVEGVGDGVGLIELAARRGIDEAAEGSETDSGQAKVKGIVGDTSDSRAAGAGDIGGVGIEIRCGNVIVVVGHAEIIGGAVFSVDPAGAGVQALRAGAAVKRWEWIHDVRGVARPVEAEIDIVLAAAVAPASAWPKNHRAGAGTEIVDQPQDYRVRVAGVGGNEMKVLAGGSQRDVRQRNKLEKGFRSGTEQGRIDCVRHTVELILLAGGRIENFDGSAIVIGGV